MDAKTEETGGGKCPVMHTAAKLNRDWWPNQLNVQVLHLQSAKSNPMGEGFDYAKEFKSLDLNAVIKDLHALMTDSQSPWFRFMTIEFIDFLRPRVLLCVLSLCTGGCLKHT
jgi:catalase-peroxidase